MPDGKKAPAPSLIDFSSTLRKENLDPLIGFVRMFERGQIDFPDVFIVGGDLGDKADTQAVRSVWTELNQLSKINPDCMLLGTCGNHDLDTRHEKNKFDPRGFLRALEPSFPYPDISRNRINFLEYWANNYSISEEERFRILNINSCAFHGFGNKAEPELEHGRISDITLDAIEAELIVVVRAAPHKLNICLFHHHIRPISTDDFEDASTMKGSQRLTEILSKPALGEWFVIHGHRHRSNLFCAGGNSAPIVLSCASFAATRVGDENNPSPNQFYIVDLDEGTPGKVSRVAGSIRTWNWMPSIGWQSQTSIPGGLPVNSGFGYRGYIPDLAKQIGDVVRQSLKIEWSKLSEDFSDVQRLMPSDIEALIVSLEMHGIIVSLADGQIRELVLPND
jgi:hypothetical protein